MLVTELLGGEMPAMCIGGAMLPAPWAAAGPPSSPGGGHMQRRCTQQLQAPSEHAEPDCRSVEIDFKQLGMLSDCVGCI